MQRARAVDVKGQAVKFASGEDLIVHKMLAGRAVDLEDVKNVLIKNRKTLDRPYIEKWLKEFEKVDEGKGLLKKFRAIMKTLM